MVLQTCVVFFGGVSGCVSSPGDWYSKRASGDVRFLSGCVEDSGRREVLVLRLVNLSKTLTS